ncbi:MAG: hypothetical protein ABFR32_12490 [Bacteroidota bacterium]
MKIKSFFSVLFIVSFFFAENLFAQQQKDNFTPSYITYTKLYSTTADVDLADWIGFEQEFFDKVTNKIDLIVSHEILVNYDKNDQNEVILINVYKSWNDIEKAREIRKELIEKAWPSKDARYAFFEKHNKHFDYYYSNQVFISTRMAKSIKKENQEKQKTPLVYYIIENKLADYEYDDSLEAYKKYINNVTYKNPFIKAYLTYKHYIGPDSRDFIQAYVVESYADLQKSLDKDRELLEKLIPNKEEREAFVEIYNEGVLNISGTGIYTNIPSMSK